MPKFEQAAIAAEQPLRGTTETQEPFMRIKKMLAALVVGAVATTTLSVATPGAAFATTSDEVTAALAAVDARNNNLVVDAAPSATDANSAAQTASFDVPVDPTQGVKLKAGNTSLTITLPGARKTERGKKRGGVVVYESKADSVNAVVPSRDGVQLWTHIRNHGAAESYRYCTEGVTFKVMPEGSAIGFDKANQPVALVPPPTATEKKTGRSIATSYVADGNCLVQHVAHKAKGTNYPVVADPIVIPAIMIWKIIRCGAGGYLGWIAAAGWNWWQRALAVAGSCIVSI